jgi:hypothetical protein
MVKALILLVALTAAAYADVRHVPPSDALAGSPVELTAEAPAETPSLVAHVRPRGTSTWHDVELVRRDDGTWIAVVPAELVAPPGIEYFITAGDQIVFATEAWPHALEVHVPDEDARRSRDLLRAHQHRSRIHSGGEWVEYGTTNVMNTKLVDHYYRFDADFAYRLWTYPVEEIRVGYTRLLGETRAEMCPSSAPCTGDAGFKVGGWFEVGLAPIEGIRFDARMIVIAATEFQVGGRLEARLGTLDGTHIAAGGEYLASVGANGYFRLGWATVPGLPMAATVEVTNLPAETRDPGVRLYYDIAREVGGGLRLGLRVGYAARTQQVAGFTGGAGATVEF